MNRGLDMLEELRVEFGDTEDNELLQLLYRYLNATVDVLRELEEECKTFLLESLRPRGPS